MKPDGTRQVRFKDVPVQHTATEQRAGLQVHHLGVVDQGHAQKQRAVGNEQE
jgi:hypothetical protein